MKKFLIQCLGISSVFPIFEPGPFEALGIVVILLFLFKDNLRIDGFTQLFACTLILSSFSLFSFNYNVISFFLMLIGILSKNHFKYYIRGVFFGLLITLILLNQGNWLGFRYQGFFKDPNLLANTSLLVILSRKTLFESRISIFVAVLLMTVLVLLANSRAHTIVLVGYFLVIIMKTLNLRSFLFFGFISLFVVYFYDFESSFNLRLLDSGYDDGRIDNWSKALKLIFVTPFGVGAGMSAHYLGFNVHNLFLQFFLENGVLSGLLFICLIFSRMGKTINIIEFFAYLLASTPFDVAHWRHFWIYIYKNENSCNNSLNR